MSDIVDNLFAEAEQIRPTRLKPTQTATKPTMEKYSIEWYKTVNTKTLTYEDAKQDPIFGTRSLKDITDYVGIDVTTLESMLYDWSDQTTLELMKCIGRYICEGEVPDKSTASESTLGKFREFRKKHEIRIQSAYLKAYKHYIGGIRKGKDGSEDE